MKKTWIALGAVVVLALGAVVYLALSLDALVARKIEAQGSARLGVPVRVGGVDIELRQAAGTISDLRVANPEGFGSGETFALSAIALVLDAESLREPPYRLKRVEVGEATVHLKLDERGRSNLDHLVRRSSGDTNSPEPGGAEPTRIAIDRLVFAGGTVLLERPGAEEPERLELPPFERSGVGGERGATGGEIAKVVTQALARQVAAVAAGQQVRRALEDQIGEEAGRAAGGVIRGLLGD